MKALSIHPYPAMMIMAGEKKYEFRTWNIVYRGEILICSTAKKAKNTIPGHALGIVTVTDSIPVTTKNYKEFGLSRQDVLDLKEVYAWKLEDPIQIVPFPVKGKLGIWNCDHEIERLPVPQTDEEDNELFQKYWIPLII